jgi:flagellar motility protein MotE (MotC chaperone)
MKRELASAALETLTPEQAAKIATSISSELP